MIELPGDDDDIFQHGCDRYASSPHAFPSFKSTIHNSLQATWIRNSILHASINSQQIDTQALSNNFVYSHPTVRRLADMLTKLTVGVASKSEEISRHVDAMEEMVQKYTQDFPQHVATAGVSKAQAVLVTGTTGALGSHILAHFLSVPETSVVYAFNRPSGDLRKRQLSSLEQNGLDIGLLDSPKLKLLAGDLNAPQFALSKEDFDALLKNVTSIVHNGMEVLSSCDIWLTYSPAWLVNFNISLSSMEPLVAGTRKLIDFALTSPLPSPPSLLFVSTVGVFRSECP
jgi:hypothetical protein